MKLISLFATLATCCLFASATPSQRLPGEPSANSVLPYEMDEVYRQCRIAPFMFAVMLATQDDAIYELGVILCLSAKTDQPITVVCDRSAKRCQTDTSQNANSLRFERELRRIEAESKKNTI